MASIAVIGAGVAGGTVAQCLNQAGHKVTVFDKSRGTGGRIASRHTQSGPVDHGTPYFEVTKPEVASFLQPALAAGVLQNWQLRFVMVDAAGEQKVEEKHCLVGMPAMSSLTRFWVQHAELVFATRIVEAIRTVDGWTLQDEQEQLYGVFDQLIVTTPPLQALPLLKVSLQLQASVRRAAMECCWVGVLESQQPCQAPYDVAVFDSGPLRRLVRHHAKPERPDKTVWQIQASPQWSLEHQELPKEQIATMLAEAFNTHSGLEQITDCQVWAQRWLYGFTAVPVGRPYLLDQEQCLGVCGDWLLGRSVEDAVSSALQLVEAMRG